MITKTKVLKTRSLLGTYRFHVVERGTLLVRFRQSLAHGECDLMWG